MDPTNLLQDKILKFPLDTESMTKWTFVHAPHFTISDEETFLQELLLENIEEMFPRYYIHGDMFSMFNSSNIFWLPAQKLKLKHFLYNLTHM